MLLYWQAKQSEIAGLNSGKRELNIRVRELEQLLAQAKEAKSARDMEYKAASTELAQLKVGDWLIVYRSCLALPLARL